MAKEWFVVHTYSGFEEKVKSSIEEKAKIKGLADKIGRILVPSEKIIEHRGKSKRQTDKKFYPGYILVEMELNDDTWLLIKNTLRVTNFIGGSKPVPLSSEEVEAILDQLQKAPAPAIKGNFTKGETVKINDGPFSTFVGQIDDVDSEHGKVKVMVSIFGRQTPVELSFSQIEKIQ